MQAPSCDYRCTKLKLAAQLSVEFSPIAQDEMVLIVPADHPWQRRRDVSIKQLSEEPMIVREPGSGSRWCLEQALAAHDLSLADLQIDIELGSNEAIKEAVRSGLGVAVLSRLSVQNEVDTGKLHALKIKDLVLDRTIYAIKARKEPLSAAASAFWRFLDQVKA